jgi:FdhE protein
MDLTFWDKQINRATELSSQSAAEELLNFYASVLSAQRRVYEFLVKKALEFFDEPSADLKLLTEAMPIVLKAVEDTGSSQLQNEMELLKASTPDQIFNVLRDYLDQRLPTQFFAKALFQPYGRLRWESGARPIIYTREEPRVCPYCNGRPQVSSLQFDVSSDVANRSLICATCLFSWPFRRGTCANCGEESPSKLAYFQAEENNHVRVETCESCRSYIKTVDLTKLGTAVPLVDDVASAALDLWATEKGYSKIEINLVGL